MENESNNQNLKILGAAILGAAAGALLALLFAPAKGSETRRKIVDTAADLGDKLRKKSEAWQNDDPEKENPA